MYENINLKSLFVYVSILLLIFNVNYAQDINDSTYEITKKIKAPGLNIKGIAWDGANLWISEDSTKMIYKIDPGTGEVKDSIQSPGNEPRGMVFKDSILYCLDSYSKKIFGINPTTGLIVDSISIVFDNTTFPNNPELMGATWDGNYFWCSFLAGFSSEIIRVNPVNGMISEHFYADSEELTFDGTYLWDIDSQGEISKGWINKRSLPSGDRLESFITNKYSPSGIVYVDAQTFWLSYEKCDSLFEISIIVTEIEEEINDIGYELLQNYPNPFNPSTTIKYSLANTADVKITIYNTMGREIYTIGRKMQQSGYHSIKWNGVNNFGQAVASGIYVCKFEVQSREEDYRNFTVSSKLLLLK